MNFLPTLRELNINFTRKIFLRYASESTIFNLSSGYGKCGVSVIRVSGPQTRDTLRAIVSKNFVPKDRYATLRSLYHPVTNEMIDKGLVIWFPGPNSFTGEDSCEFQVHGSLAVVEAMFDALGSIPGLRLSQPGEFTKRSFFAGKLDLTEVEGLADLIHAETEAQRKQALLQSTGSLSKVYKNWRERLIKCVAHMEAYIDFAEDENIEDDLLEKLKTELLSLRENIQNHLNDHRQGEILRHGVRTTIIGAPNVGKSSFLNLMCQRKVSIVTPIAGTTRDVIESFHNICGYPVLFADTAGLRTLTDDVVEKEGISRAKDRIGKSDLLLLIVDATELSKRKITNKAFFEGFKEQYLKELGITTDLLSETSLLVILNKVDLISSEDLEKLKNLDVALVSCLTTKMENLFQKMEDKLKYICSQPTADNPRLTNSRYRQELISCSNYITVFLDNYTTNPNQDLAIAAQTLRKAVKCIEKITGNVSTDDILDVVFRDFCIGK
ncbi:tRNA modification GTPase GTPBP3, mitochondrial [Episyrphus balteatus]|uniref:tRNA modification GTPase GTPBP3, mitochondrial n=1 Tax=Episyrphus balteatus TaxID=286459 RepID=UPI002485AC00|nr:tRNA modification GTPase GTPBP3, mitochondrial [Episyrphus balteatus]